MAYEPYKRLLKAAETSEAKEGETESVLFYLSESDFRYLVDKVKANMLFPQLLTVC